MSINMSIAYCHLSFPRLAAGFLDDDGMCTGVSLILDGVLPTKPVDFNVGSGLFVDTE